MAVCRASSQTKTKEQPMTRILNLATAVLSLAAIPLASGTVEEWSGRTLGVDYTITD